MSLPNKSQRKASLTLVFPIPFIPNISVFAENEMLIVNPLKLTRDNSLIVSLMNPVFISYVFCRPPGVESGFPHVRGVLPIN